MQKKAHQLGLVGRNGWSTYSPVWALIWGGRVPPFSPGSWPRSAPLAPAAGTPAPPAGALCRINDGKITKKSPLIKVHPPCLFHARIKIHPPDPPKTVQIEVHSLLREIEEKRGNGWTSARIEVHPRGPKKNAPPMLQGGESSGKRQKFVDLSRRIPPPEGPKKVRHQGGPLLGGITSSRKGGS